MYKNKKRINYFLNVLSNDESGNDVVFTIIDDSLSKKLSLQKIKGLYYPYSYSYGKTMRI